MRDACTEILLKWLNNAYAMELAIVKTLESHAKEAEEMPEMRGMIEDHIETTKDQAERVREAIERNGGDTSTIKAESAEMMGWVQGKMTAFSDDKIVKNAIAEHATEHFEMGAYMAIAEAARMCGDSETEQMAKEIMEEEIETGEKLKENLPKLVNSYINKKKIEENEEEE